MLEPSAYVKIFVAILAILNPFGVLPVFLALTGKSTEQERKKIARTVGVSVASVLALTALIGDKILHLFGISIASFQVGGSILLLLMAISMMFAKDAKGSAEAAEIAPDLASIAVVPLSVPLLAGPGSISTVIIYANLPGGTFHVWLIILCVFLGSFVIWIVLRMANRIGKLIGPLGLSIVSRLMGLLLASIAVEFFAKGIVKLLPGLA
ncbi:MAG: NAAT family transporter [Deltaproteobacteria bacterium]|nr:NAAT family transporter [Deltaproteobacteria bacterium]TLN03349.1 MAG: NAAT family transporter [bacterium]